MSNLLNTTTSQLSELEETVGRAALIKKEIDDIEKNKLNALKNDLETLKVKILRDMQAVGLTNVDGIKIDPVTQAKEIVARVQILRGKTADRYNSDKLATLLTKDQLEETVIKGRSYEFIKFFL